MTESHSRPPFDQETGDEGRDRRNRPDLRGRAAELLLVAAPFVLLALFLVLEWWVRS